MNNNKLQIILQSHKLWLNGASDGKRANLLGANLLGADLQGADLWKANLRGADLRGANLRGANLQGADLQGADLQGADLQEADLRYADLDYTNYPLRCGSIGIKVDSRLPIQQLYHIARLDIVTDDTELLELINSELYKKVANKFHRVDECGRL